MDLEGEGAILANRGDHPVYVTVSRRGIAEEPVPPNTAFATIERAYYDIATGEVSVKP